VTVPSFGYVPEFYQPCSTQMASRLFKHKALQLTIASRDSSLLAEAILESILKKSTMSAVTFSEFEPDQVSTGVGYLFIFR